MSISKATLLSSLRFFKEFQDFGNEKKFVAQETGKGLISNTDQSKLDGISAGAQVNVIESISIDGIQQTVMDKNVELDLSAYLQGAEEPITRDEIQALFN